MRGDIGGRFASVRIVGTEKSFFAQDREVTFIIGLALREFYCLIRRQMEVFREMAVAYIFLGRASYTDMDNYTPVILDFVKIVIRP